MPTQHSIEAEGILGRQPITLKVDLPPQSLFNPAIYAPAIPGVLVAAVGLWIAHRFTRSRDRRKEISDLCSDFSKAIDSAAEAAVAAWLEEDATKRPAKVSEAKRKIQAAGIVATNLKRRSAYSRFSSFRTLLGGPRDIDVVAHVSNLRRATTADPFEDPSRSPDSDRAEAAATESLTARAAADLGFARLFGHA